MPPAPHQLPFVLPPDVPTDISRWRANVTAVPPWMDRNRVIASWIPPASSVIDVGAGSMSLRDVLPAGCHYQPVDVVLPDPTTRFADFNAFTTPVVDSPADVVVCSGLLEYVVDPAYLLRTVRGWGRSVILSYAVAGDPPDLDGRRRAGWVNHLSAESLIDLAREAGLVVAQREMWQSQMLLMLESADRAPAPELDRPRWPVTLYRADRTNVGDWFSAPGRYLAELRGPEVDIVALKTSSLVDTSVIIGGGGLFSPEFNALFARTRFSPSHPVVGWGLGENMRIDTVTGWVDEGPATVPGWASRCDLLGVRDFGATARWVPCASCLHPSLLAPRAAIHDVVVFEHKRIPIDAGDLPRQSNDGNDIDATLDFLGSGHVVVTNSYHGAYWATLLGRAVVAFPFSSKFWGLRHRPILCRPSEWRRAVDFARAYPTSLAECRQASHEFAQDVRALVGRRLEPPGPRRTRRAHDTAPRVWSTPNDTTRGLEAMKVGRVQQAAIARFLADRGPVLVVTRADDAVARIGGWRGVVVGPGVVPPLGLARLLAPAGRVVLVGSEHAGLDPVKASLHEHEHIGRESMGRHDIWCGGVDPLRRDGAEGSLPVVASYFTADTPYEDEARALDLSCRAAGVRSDIRPAQARGSWEANCAHKASFLQQLWHERREPLLWVDADARVLQSPALLRGAPWDFAVHKVDGWEFASGTIFFNNTSRAGVLLETWERLCRRHPHVLDQILLDLAWEEVSRRHPLVTGWLPSSYTAIFDRPEVVTGGTVPVIAHFQASRRLKREVSTLAAPRPIPQIPPVWQRARRASRAWTRDGGTLLAAKLVNSSTFVPFPGTPVPEPDEFRRFDTRVRRWLAAHRASVGAVAVFGASWFGARLCTHLRTIGLEPIACLDNAVALEDGALVNVPITTPSSERLRRCDTVIVASLEHGAAIEAQIRDLSAGSPLQIVAAHQQRLGVA